MTITNTSKRVAFAGFVALAIAMGVGRFAFTPLLPLMLSENLLDISSGGTLASVHFFGYAAGALLAMRMTLSPRLAVFLFLSVIALSTMAMGFTQLFSVWLFARLVAGICSAFVLVSVSTHLVRHLAENGRPDLQGWVFAGVGAGIALVGLATLVLMAGSISSVVGWQLLGIATLVASVCLFMWGNLNSSTVPAQREQHAQSHTPLSFSLLLPYGAMGLGYIIPATYLPVMAKAAVSSPLIFGWGWPVFGLAAALSTLMVARLNTRYSNRQIWVASQLVMAVGLVAPALWSNIAAVMVAGICVGGTFMVITMVGMMEAHRFAGHGDAGRHIAAMTAAFAAGQVIGPVFASWLHSWTNSFSYPLLFASIILMATCVPLFARISAKN